MDARFDLLRPAWTVVAWVTIAALTAYVRARQRRGATGGLGPTLAAAIVAVALGCGLLAIGTPAAHAVLALLAVAAAFALAWVLYAPARRDSLGPRGAAVCRLCRAAALVGLVALVGRPACNSTERLFERPSLVVLLDQSQSMSIRDGDEGPSRAETANAAFARADLHALDPFHDVRLMGLGKAASPLTTWRIDPTASSTAIAAALRSVAGAKDQASPSEILLISDGAENTVDATVVVQAARELEDQGIALYAVGIGPAANATVNLTIEPLAVPSRVSYRDRVNVPVIAHAAGMGRRSVRMEWLWDDAVFESRAVSVPGSALTLRETARSRPPHTGLVRLSVRVAALDGPETAEASTVVDVQDASIRVLIADAQPTSETAFVARALRGDPRFEPVVRLHPTGKAAAARLPLDDVDVVLLTDAHLDADDASALVEAVDRDGVGLLLAGGYAMFNAGDAPRAELRRVSPVEFVLRTEKHESLRFRPTEEASRHPAMEGLPDRNAAVWSQLPEIPGGVRWGDVKPLATVLARDQDDRPILAAQEFGRGRCMAAAWEATWPWALASDEGLKLHRAFWRQLVVWLANRRPAAWVLAEEPRYSLDALRSGSRTIAIRAGVSSVDSDRVKRNWTAMLALTRQSTGDLATMPASTTQPAGSPSAETQPSASRPVAGPWEVSLKRRGDEWVAELPEALASSSWLAAGEFQLELEVRGTGPGGGDPIELDARSGFVIERVNPELVAPTANLALLKRAADQTRHNGGRYVDINHLPDLLATLAQQDHRKPVERAVQRAPVRDQPWQIWALIIGALGIEWSVRKRNNLL